MTLPAPLFLAVESLRGGRRSRLLPALLVAASCASLVVALAVARGFDAGFLGKLLLANGHARARPEGEPGFADWREAVATLRGRGLAAAPRFAAEGVLETAAHSVGVRALGVVMADERDVSAHLSAFAGLPEEGDWIVVGDALARETGLLPGASVRLRGTGDPRAFRVAGTFAIGLSDYDRSFVYLPLPAAAALFDYPELATEIVLALDDPDAAPARAAALSAEFPGVRVEPWQARNAALVATLAVERFALRLFCALVATLALSGVAFMLVVASDERRRSIGILVAYGMSLGQVRLAFALEGLMLSAAGTAAGVLIGVLGSSLLARLAIPLPAGFAQTYASPRLPVSLAAEDVAYVAAAFCVLALAASLGATARLARLPVRDLMRG